MGASQYYGNQLPDQASSPPDVVTWLTRAVNDLEGILQASDPIKVQVATAPDQPLRRDAVKYGPVASVPATLGPGVVYLGWD